jgi:hypothetical protein
MYMVRIRFTFKTGYDISGIKTVEGKYNDATSTFARPEFRVLT